MFSKDITGSDAFREMPTSTQALYFHLGMDADDDGFLDNYKGLMRSINASEDDLKILLSKRFLILFPTKIIVVKHWLINNTIRSDRYKETKHLDEKRALIVKENGSYTELNKVATSGIPSGNQMATQYRIEKDRIEKDRIEKDRIVPAPSAGGLGSEVIDLFKELNPSYKSLFPRKSQHAAANRLLEVHGIERIKKIVQFVVARRADRFCPSIATPVQLEDKWSALEKYAVGLKGDSGKGKGIISSVE